MPPHSAASLNTRSFLSTSFTKQIADYRAKSREQAKVNQFFQAMQQTNGQQQQFLPSGNRADAFVFCWSGAVMQMW